MRLGVLALVWLTTSGCFFVVPKTHKKETRIWEEKSGQEWAAPASLTATIDRVSGRTVTVHAQWTGTCSYTRSVHREQRRWRRAGFKVVQCRGSDCGYGYFFGILAAPITIPVSALITLATVAGEDATTIVETEHKATLQEGCTADAGGVGLTVVGAGQEVDATTDRQGRAQVQLRDEATARSVTVRVHAPPAR